MLAGSIVTTGMETLSYAVSPDEQRVAFVKNDERGTPRLWITATDKRSAPEMVGTQGSADSPNFLPNGDLMFRAVQDTNDYVFRKAANGGAVQKVLNEPVISLETVSPDGKWVLMGLQEDKDREHIGRVKAVPLQGGPAVTLCRAVCFAQWDATGKGFLVNWMQAAETYVLPVKSKTGLPDVPEGGFPGPEAMQGKATAKIPVNMSSAASADLYSYTRISIRRNIYRIPIE